VGRFRRARGGALIAFTETEPVQVSRTEPDPPQSSRQERQHRDVQAHSRRPFLILLLVGGVFGITLVTVAAVVAARRDATVTLVEPSDSNAEIQAALTITGIDVPAGELQVRLVPTVVSGDRVAGGVVTQGFRIFVNDAGGETTHTFQPGEPLRSIDFAVSLGGGSIFRYPFDRYEADVLVLAADDTESDDGEPLAVDTTATSSLASYRVDAELNDQCRGVGGTCLDVEVRRPFSTIGYVVWFMALAWALALAGVGVLWVVVRRGVDLPLWAFGYLVGVLFALPPLRASVPGTPPSGGFVDYVAFYWAIAVIGVTLIALIALWIRENRRA